MALTEEQKEIAFRHLETKAVKGCAFCGQKKFELKNLVVTNLVEGKIVDTTSGIPMLPVVCANCFHISFFSAVPMGLSVS